MEDNRKTADALIKEVAKTRDLARDVAENTWEKGRESLKDLRERGEESIQEIREQGEAIWDDTQKLVRKYPGKAIGLALLVGTVVGAFISLRSSD
jgi:ElaB/YqjD/DUF883 family membrane-anchored ribosome-binding protein